MIRAKHFKKIVVIEPEGKKEYNDVVLIPSELLKSILKYNNELLKENYNSLTDYGKGIVDTIKEQHNDLSINLDR
jgi:hypothetical protein